MTHKIDPKSKIRASALLLALASLAGVPLSGHAAGLGKVNVLSALGQPLRAEVEIAASKDELSSMVARIASPDSFRQAGIDYASTLVGLKLSIDKRANGQPVVRLTSDRPINDPFLDLLLEIDWPAGRLVREYTFLLDPPEVTQKASLAGVVPPDASVPVTRPAPVAVNPRAPMESPRADVTKPEASKPEASKPDTPPEKPAGKNATKPKAVEKPELKPETKPEATADGKPAPAAGTHTVEKGETLHKIAAASKYEGVTLDQMLVAIYRANKDAFEGGNANRLQTGRILNIPDRESVAAISDSEARKVIVSQSGDWNSYRRRLATATADAPAQTEAPKQQTKGKVTAKVADDTPKTAEVRDQVRISRAEVEKEQKRAKVAEEDLIAKEKALKEANARLAMLEKNVADLQKLVQMKDQNLAELQKQAAAKDQAAKDAAAKAASAPVVSSKPVPAPAPAPVPAPEVKKVEPPPPPAPAPAPEVKAPVDSKPAPAPEVAAPVPPAPPPVPAPEAKVDTPPAPPAADAKDAGAPPAPPAVAPEPPKKKVAPPPPPPPEPDLMDTVMDQLPLIGGGLLAVLGLGGFVAWRRRRQAQAAVPVTTSLPSQPSLGAASVFKNTGGQSVDTSNTPVTDFSQAGPGTIDTDEVDPVAEADVYMAYGRDAQAEEILIEALQKDPKRTAIHVKLLEIYANRRSVKQFETLASELYALTGGVGGDWEKAAALGLRLDPSNPLFGGKQENADFNPDATLVATNPEKLKATVTLPGSLGQMAEAAQSVGSATDINVPPAAKAAPAADTAFDFPSASVSAAAEPAPVDLSLDFDLGAPEPAVAAVPAPAHEEPVFDLGSPDEVVDIAAPAPAQEPAASLTETPGALDFDLDIGHTSSAAVSAPTPAADSTQVIDFDLPDIEIPVESPLVAEEPAPADDNLIHFDLGTSEPVALTATAAAAPAPAPAPRQEEQETVDLGTIDGDSLEFDVKLTESTVLGTPGQFPSFDMSALSLDLDEPSGPLPTMPSADEVKRKAAEAPLGDDQTATVVSNVDEGGVAGSGDPRWQEVATKLDLARAYEDMGDMEGAKELLNEVLVEGDAAQKAQAQEVLARIA